MASSLEGISRNKGKLIGYKELFIKELRRNKILKILQELTEMRENIAKTEACLRDLNSRVSQEEGQGP